MKIDDLNFVDVTNIPMAGVYLLMDKEEIVYIGSSISVWERINKHIRTMNGDRQQETIENKIFDKILVYACGEEQLDAIEFNLWIKYKPKYNKAIPSGRARGRSSIQNSYSLDEIIKAVCDQSPQGT